MSHKKIFLFNLCFDVKNKILNVFMTRLKKKKLLKNKYLPTAVFYMRI